VTYRVRVADSRPAPRGPNVTWSGARTLTIVAPDDALLAQRDAAERSTIQAQLDAIKQANAANRRETEQLRYAADAAGRGNGTWDKSRDQALNGREAAARDVADRLQLLARDLDDHPLFAPAGAAGAASRRGRGRGGPRDARPARRAPDAAGRLADLQQADARLGAVQDRLEELQRRLDALARLDADRRRLRELARRAERLAALAAALKDGPAADRARLDQLQAEQEQLRRDLEDCCGNPPSSAPRSWPPTPARPRGWPTAPGPWPSASASRPARPPSCPAVPPP
jgi:DNA repair exonuclease SbcCD ATPase subunit